MLRIPFRVKQNLIKLYFRRIFFYLSTDSTELSHANINIINSDPQIIKKFFVPIEVPTYILERTTYLTINFAALFKILNKDI